MKFSNRVKVGEPNAVARAEREVASRGARLTRLADSNPTRHGLGSPDLPEYQASPRGPLAARAALADFLSRRDGREVDPERLYLLSSTSQAYSWLMKLFCDPGDWVAAPTPGYPLVEEIARLEAVNVTYYPLEWVGRWELNLAGFAPASVSAPFHEAPAGTPANPPNCGLADSQGADVSSPASSDPSNPQPHPTAIIAINPNNPTGSYVQDFERVHLVEYASAQDVPLIADEVFFDFWLETGQHLMKRRRLAGETRVLTFALDGLSKNLAAPGAKVAWIEVSGPGDLVAAAQARLDVIADAYLPFSDCLAARLPGWLAEVPAQVERVRGRCQANLARLRDLVAGEPTGTVTVLAPEGGWNVLLRFPAVVDEASLVASLISARGISVQPGYFFDMPFPGVVSVSLLLEAEVFAAAVGEFLELYSTLVS